MAHTSCYAARRSRSKPPPATYASRRAGHDLAAFGGRTLRAVSYLLELDRPSTEKQYRATVVHGRGVVVGGWITVSHDLGDTEVFALTERAAALASRGRR